MDGWISGSSMILDGWMGKQIEIKKNFRGQALAGSEKN